VALRVWRIAASASTASPAVVQTSVISSTWQACSSGASAPSPTSPTRSSTAADALTWPPVTGSTRNSSSSTPIENGRPEPNRGPVSSGSVTGRSYPAPAG
jgi:hypothetical protein